jgi:hypothetical protein
MPAGPEVEYVVLGKLGDHCKKVIELELLIEKEPHFAKSLQLQIDARQEVIRNWPMTDKNREQLRYTFVALADTMRGMAAAELGMYNLCKEQAASPQQFIYAISQFKFVKDNAKTLLSYLNTLGDE